MTMTEQRNKVMSTQSKAKENKVLVTDVSVKGGDLPVGYQCYLNLEFDFTDVSAEELQGLCCEGSSLRVKAQAQLRKWTTTKLTESGVQAVEGLTAEVKEQLSKLPPVKFVVDTDFEKAESGPRDPVKTATSAFAKMDSQTKYDYLIGIGVPADTAKLSAFGEETSETDDDVE